MRDLKKGNPDRLVLFGEGLRQMAPDQYGTLVKNLGRMGIEVCAMGSEREEIPIEPLNPNSVTKEMLLGFARENGYKESSVARLWNSLVRFYRVKKDAIEKKESGQPFNKSNLRYPIEFKEIESGVLIIPMSSLEATVRCLLTDDSSCIRNFGDRSLSFLAHYLNEILNPEEPY